MSWPPKQWSENDLKRLAEFLMVNINPYSDYFSSSRPNWKEDAVRDNVQTIWTFRGTPLRIDRSVQVPFNVRYPKSGVPNPNQSKPVDWEDHDSREYILVGFVGSGGH
jgi:hypothetical protein